MEGKAIVRISTLVQSTPMNLGTRLSLDSLELTVRSLFFFATSPLVEMSFRSYLVSTYHIFCSARIVYLITVFNLRGSVIAAHTWSLIRYILSDSLCRVLSRS